MIATAWNNCGTVRVVLGEGAVLIVQMSPHDDAHASAAGIYVGVHVGRTDDDRSDIMTECKREDAEWLVPAVCGLDYLTSLDGVEEIPTYEE